MLFRSICCGFVCSTKHQKAQYRALACKYVSAQCHSVMYSPPCPPTRRAYHAFAAFSVLLWFRLFHKAPKSTNTLLFRAVCCGFVCSTKHQNAPKLVFRAHWFQHRATVLCVRLHSEPPPPPVFSVFWCFFVFAVISSGPKSTNTVLFRSICCGFVCSTKHQKAPALLFRATSFQQSVTLLCVRLPSTLHPSCFWCFFVVAVVSSRPQNTNTVFFVHAFKRGHNWKTNIYYNVKGRKTKASSFRAIDISVFCWFRRIFFSFF